MPVRCETREGVDPSVLMVLREGDDTLVISAPLGTPGVDTMALVQLVPHLLTYEERAEIRKMFGMPDLKVASKEAAHDEWRARGMPVLTA